jgi:iron complex transport system substrate-binding protein
LSFLLAGKRSRSIFKRESLVLLVALVVLLAMACDVREPTASHTSVVTSPHYPVTVTDTRGTSVVFTEAPKRIVSLSPAHTEVFYALGLGDRIVGRDSYSDFPPEARLKPKVGGAFNLSLEALVALEPDLVYTTFETPVADIEGLGIRVLYLFPPADVQGVLDNMALIGQVTDREVQAQALVKEMEARIKAVTDKLAGVELRLRTYYEIDPGLWTVGPGSFVGDILQSLHVQNVAEGASSPYPQLSAEVIVDQDPEIILLGDSKEYLSTGITVEEVVARHGWSDISAVMENRVYPFNDSLLSRPGPRIAEGIEQLAQLLYPELFQ